MFTGIITDIGRIASIEKDGDMSISIETDYDVTSIDLGASICCSGICLTVTDKAERQFAVDISMETISCTAAGQWDVGTRLNLERSLRVGDELGGHIVTGHVDGTGEILDIRDDEGSKRLTISMPQALAPYIAKKGSIAVNGVSLTVNAVEDKPRSHFDVNIIPHTLDKTTLGNAKRGEKVNLEIDILARYLARMQEQA